MTKIVLNGRDLTIGRIDTILKNSKVKVEIAEEALWNVRRSLKFVKNHLQGQIVYGINTGFGPMASHILADDQLIILQENLVRSHAMGMGLEIDQKYVLAAMIVRLNTLVRGCSGVSEELLDQLQFFINNRITPIIYEHGAVGTSGDLVQLAHIALALIGEGEVNYEGQKYETKEVLKKLKRPAYKLKAKEGLALINGTSVMTGIASAIASDAIRVLDIAVLNGCLALELVEAYEDSLAETLHALRPHVGQKAIASQMRHLLAKSRLLKKRSDLKNNILFHNKVEKITQDVQEVYSFRCIPQILGPVYDTLQSSIKTIEIEMNSVTDNPIIDVRNENFLHGGNFHGDYIAATVDQLKAAMIKLSILSERRTNYFLNQKLNLRFPPFLNLYKPGLSLALQPLQFIATSTTAQSQSLGYPHYLHSISTNADNQDVVSMGTDAALIAQKVIENAFIVLAVEILTLAQAVDLTKNRNGLTKSTGKFYDEIRKVFPVIIKDRVVIEELKKVISLMKNCPSSALDWGNTNK